MIGKPEIGVGIVGYAFMGRAHSFGWRTAARAFDLPLHPRMAVVVGRDGAAASRAAVELGWAEASTDWRRLLERDDVDLVDICTPGDSHAEIAIAALRAGKHVLCEKPLANTLAEAEAMVAAAASARPGVKAMVGFNYRRVPAARFARELIDSGRLGTVRHVRATYLQDWIVDPEFPLVWRLRKELAGSGALGDIGAHIVDLVQFMIGDRITAVSALAETFVTERPLPAASSGLSATGSALRGPVTVDDAALFLARFAGGAVGTFEATRFATGRKNQLRIEVNGSLGSVVFDMESLNELLYYDRTDDPTTAGFRRILVTEPTHPYLSGWWPPGHLLGWDHTFVHEIADLVTAIGNDTPVEPSFADGLGVQRVLDAVLVSSETGRWQRVGGHQAHAPGTPR
jgi:predicted dehydrogenase